MHDAGHATVLPREPDAVSAIADAYLAQAGGDAAAALRRAIGDGASGLGRDGAALPTCRASGLARLCARRVRSTRELTCATSGTSAKTIQPRYWPL